MEKTNNIKARIVGRTRRGRIVRLVSAFVLIPTVAFAAILMLARVTGDVAVGSTPTVSWVASGASFKTSGSSSTTAKVEQTATDMSGIVCTPTVTNGVLNIDVTSALPGSWCEVTAPVKASKYGVKVQDFTLGQLDVAFLPTSEQVCGSDMGFPNAANGEAKYVKFRVTVPEDATSGSLGTDIGLTGVLSGQYVAGDCTTPTL